EQRPVRGEFGPHPLILLGHRNQFFPQCGAHRPPFRALCSYAVPHRPAAGRGSGGVATGPTDTTIPGTYSVISRMTRQGLPAATAPSGLPRVPPLPAPMPDRAPTFTPGHMIAPPPSHTSEPISMGLPNSCFRRSPAFIGWVAV